MVGLKSKAIVMLAVVILVLAACGSTAAPSAAPSSPPTNTSAPSTTPTEVLASIAPASAGPSTGAATAIAAGSSHACALLSDGSVMCWGVNGYGQLGNGSTSNSTSPPVRVTGLTSGVQAIAAHGDYTCALTGGGGVQCFGRNIFGQLGNGSMPQSPVPVDVTGLTSGVAAISAGNDQACAVTNAGGVKCWGWNANGELGNGSTTNSSIPVDVTSLTSGVTAIAAGSSTTSGGSSFTCAITGGGGVKCWGAGAQGQLGNGTTTDSLIPVDVAGLASGVTAIATGAEYACALTSGGGVKCWGGKSTVPLDVVGVTSGVSAIAVAADQSEACAVSSTGGVKCWGTNNPTPADYPGLSTDVSAIVLSATTGTPFVCALTPAGVVRCFSSTTGVGFVDVAGLAPAEGGGQEPGPSGAPASGNATAIAAGFGHTCSITIGGGVKCWGLNNSGQLGNGSTTLTSSTPVDVVGLGSGVAAIAAGSGYTCALTSGGGVKCWGGNKYGQLGNSSTTSSLVPVDVSGLASGVTSIVLSGTAVGTGHACALTSAGGVKCWGSGTLGNGDTTGVGSPTPVDVTGLKSGVTALAANWGDTCALMAAGGVKCWGTGFLGNGKPSGYSLTPVDVVGLLSGVSALAGGGQNTCVITTGGGLMCWGEDHSGQLGVTPTTSFFSSATPVDIPGLTGGVKAVSLGSFHLCALTSAGGVKCWGNNSQGQLGNGTLASSSTGAPGDVSGLTSGVTALSAGNDHTCALMSAGGVKCWGGNASGALGSGSTATQATTPIDVAGL